MLNTKPSLCPAHHILRSCHSSFCNREYLRMKDSYTKNSCTKRRCFRGVSTNFWIRPATWPHSVHDMAVPISWSPSYILQHKTDYFCVVAMQLSQSKANCHIKWTMSHSNQVIEKPVTIQPIEYERAQWLIKKIPCLVWIWLVNFEVLGQPIWYYMYMQCFSCKLIIETWYGRSYSKILVLYEPRLGTGLSTGLWTGL